MDDWYTVRQAAYDLEISVQRVYALIHAGTLSSRLVGLTRMVNRRSVQAYKASPTRNKFAGRHLREAVPDDQLVIDYDDDIEASPDSTEWSGLHAPLLSDEARRLYYASPIGQRAARLEMADARGEG